MTTAIADKRYARILTDDGSGTQLGASGALGSVVELDHDEIAVSFQAIWTATATGTFKVQVSNSPNSALDELETWADVSGATFSAAGGPGNGMVDVKTGARFARLYYTRTSGNGSCEVNYCKKKGSS